MSYQDVFTLCVNVQFFHQQSKTERHIFRKFFKTPVFLLNAFRAFVFALLYTIVFRFCFAEMFAFKPVHTGF